MISYFIETDAYNFGSAYSCKGIFYTVIISVICFVTVNIQFKLPINIQGCTCGYLGNYICIRGQ